MKTAQIFELVEEACEQRDFDHLFAICSMMLIMLRIFASGRVVTNSKDEVLILDTLAQHAADQLGILIEEVKKES